jgi:hypothetical protein
MQERFATIHTNHFKQVLSIISCPILLAQDISLGERNKPKNADYFINLTSFLSWYNILVAF